MAGFLIPRIRPSVTNELDCFVRALSCWHPERLVASLTATGEPDPYGVKRDIGVAPLHVPPANELHGFGGVATERAEPSRSALARAAGQMAPRPKIAPWCN